MHFMSIQRFSRVWAACVGISLFLGCAKESEPATTESGTISQPDAAQTAPSAPAQSGPSAETVVSDRSIAYIQGLVERGEYARAQQALTNLEGKQLSPAQQRKIQELKARMAGH